MDSSLLLKADRFVISGDLWAIITPCSSAEKDEKNNQSVIKEKPPVFGGGVKVDRGLMPADCVKNLKAWGVVVVIPLR